MTIRKAVLLSACLFSIALSANAAAQSGDGSLRGIVNDEQGAAMPGVTVTATSPQAIAPAVAVTDASGEYRLTNLAPGPYTLTRELAGFFGGRARRDRVARRRELPGRTRCHAHRQPRGVDHRVGPLADGRSVES